MCNRRLNTAFDDPSSNGEAGETCNIVDMQLLHEMLTMLFDGFDADAKVRSHLPIDMAFGNHLQQISFTRSKLSTVLFPQANTIRCFLVIVVQMFGNRCGKKGFTFMQFTNGLGYDLAGCEWLYKSPHTSSA